MSSGTTIPVAVIDDHTLLRSILADMIDKMPGYRVVLQAGHGREYIAAVEQGVDVSVAIVDLHMPVMDGYATIDWIRANQPGTRPVALTFERTEESRAKALHNGACGYLLKDVSQEGFRRALDQVATIGHCHDALDGNGTDALHGQATQIAGDRYDHLPLTDREIQFIQLVCDPEEFTYEQIADKMLVHHRTVDGYRESVFGKLKLKSKAGLVSYGYRHGLVKH